MPETDSITTLCFGVFELDLKGEELRKSGIPLKIQPQPLKVLTMLALRAGEVVTREEIRDQIWGADTFVEFDQGLNFCIKQIRTCLNDDPSTPRYVQTIHRKGYKFIAPVEKVDENSVVIRSARPVTEEVSAAPSPSEIATSLADRISRFRPNDLLGALHSHSHTVSNEGTDGDVLPPPKYSTDMARNVAGVVVVIALAAALFFDAAKTPPSTESGAVKTATAAPATSSEVRLVVLPFDNLSGNREDDYLGEGMTEEISAQLGRLQPQKIAVLARTAAEQYGHGNKTLDQIGRDLKVDYYVEGSVRRNQKQLRITAQLIRAEDQVHVWAQTYDGSMDTLFELQDQIAKAVSREISLVVTGIVPTAAKIRGSTNAEAQDAYLRGRYFWFHADPAQREKSCNSFADAIDKDPKFALAYAALADCLEAMVWLGRMPQAEALPRARAAALKSIELDDNLAEAHAAYGNILLGYDWDWIAAEGHLRHALELDQNSAEAHRRYGTYLRNMGKMEEGLRHLKRGAELDPLSTSHKMRLGWSYGFLNDWGSSIDVFTQVTQMEPTFAGGYIGLRVAHEYRKEYDQAIAAWVKALERSNSAPLGKELQDIYRTSGYPAAKRYVLTKQVEGLLSQPKGRIRPFEIAALYTDLGNVDKAMEWMGKAYQERNKDLYEIKVNHRFDVLRKDPRFQKILRDMKLD